MINLDEMDVNSHFFPSCPSSPPLQTVALLQSVFSSPVNKTVTTIDEHTDSQDVTQTTSPTNSPGPTNVYTTTTPLCSAKCSSRPTRRVDVEQGGTLLLSCPTGGEWSLPNRVENKHGEPVPLLARYQWLKNGEPLMLMEAEGLGGPQTLETPNVQVDDGGHYSCGYHDSRGCSCRKHWTVVVTPVAKSE